MAPVVGLPLKLPLELSALIRELLDLVDIVQCTRVCRSWRNHILSHDSLYDLVTKHETHNADDSARLPVRLASTKLRARMLNVLPLIEAHHFAMPAAIALKPRKCRKALLAGHFLLRQLETWQFEIIDLPTGRTFPSPDNGSRPLICIALTRSHSAYVQGDVVYHGRIGAQPETFKCADVEAIAGQGETFLVLRRMKKAGRDGVGLVWKDRRTFLPAKKARYDLILDGKSWVVFGKEIIKPGMRRPIEQVLNVTRVGLARHVWLVTETDEYLLDLDTLDTTRVNVLPRDGLWAGWPSRAGLWKGKQYRWQRRFPGQKEHWGAGDGKCDHVAQLVVNDSYVFAWHGPGRKCAGSHLYCFDPGLMPKEPFFVEAVDPSLALLPPSPPSSFGCYD